LPTYWWYIISAPVTSQYYVYDTQTLLNTTSELVYDVKNNATAAGGVIESSKFNFTTKFYRRDMAEINLTCTASSTTGDRDNTVLWDTCFRPDINGRYRLGLAVYTPRYNCHYRNEQVIDVTCSGFEPKAIVSNQTVTLWRSSNVHVTLNGSASRDTQTSIPLSYSWNFFSGPTNVLSSSVSIFNAKTPTADVVLSVAGVYIFSFTVSDGCNSNTAYAKVTAACVDKYLPTNSSLYSAYDGTVPINMMSLSYDYTNTMPSTVETCLTTYSWNLVAYAEPATITSGASGVAHLSLFVAVFLALFHFY